MPIELSAYAQAIEKWVKIRNGTGWDYKKRFL